MACQNVDKGTARPEHSVERRKIGKVTPRFTSIRVGPRKLESVQCHSFKMSTTMENTGNPWGVKITRHLKTGETRLRNTPVGEREVSQLQLHLVTRISYYINQCLLLGLSSDSR